MKVSMLCNIRLTTVSPPKGCYKVSLVKLKEHMLHHLFPPSQEKRVQAYFHSHRELAR